MPKFCFVGDLHFEALDKYYAKESKPNRFIFEQLDKVLAYCRKAGIKHVFQLGDVFDHPYPDQNSIKELLQFLYKHSDINFYIIAGNHDYSNVKTTSLEVGTFLSETNLLTNVKIYTKAQHEVVEGVNIFYASYPVYEKFDYLKGTPCLCLGHFEVKGAKHDSGQIIKTGVPLEKLEKEDSWVLGHLHRHQQISKKIHYTGTMLQYNFGEPLPKGFTVSDITVSDTGQLEVSHNPIKLDTPYVLENVHINQQEDFEQLKLNDPKYFYKIFIENSDVVVPNKLVSGATTNIYKIIYSKEGSRGVSQDAQSLSETFKEDEDKIKLFEPLGGLEEHLEEEGLTTDEIIFALAKINSLKQEYSPKRD